MKDLIINDIERLELRRELYKQNAKQGDFLSFIYYINTDYKANWHHKIIIKELQAFLTDPTKKNLAIFIPPQHGKSEITSRLFPAYALGVNPNLKIAISSYSSDLADSFNRDIQKYIDLKDYYDVFPETQLNSKNVVTTQNWLRNSEVFEIVGKKGFLKSVGVGGGLTGRAVDIAIIDDPIKDDKEAQSPTFRENVWQWYIKVLMTRLHNNSKQVLIMTRWHEDDLAGRLLNPEINPNYKDWHVIKLQAIKEEITHQDDKRNEGESLWPQRHDLEKLNILKSLSFDAFESLYQQNPFNKSGNKINRDRFHIVDQYQISFDKIDIWIDGAYTEKAKNDPTGVIPVLFNSKLNTCYILDFQTQRMELPELLEFLPNYFEKIGITVGSKIYIEPKASGKSIKQMLVRTTKYPVIEIQSYLVQEGKESRFQAAAPYIESGQMKFKRGSWNESLINQMVGFPKVKHDEAVDLLGYISAHYFKASKSPFMQAVASDNLL
ncbi:MAG: phage terminase large subunit [Saprospiraceae bacterium]